MDPLVALRRALAFVVVALLLAWMASGEPQVDDGPTAYSAPAR